MGLDTFREWRLRLNEKERKWPPWATETAAEIGPALPIIIFMPERCVTANCSPVLDKFDRGIFAMWFISMHVGGCYKSVFSSWCFPVLNYSSYHP